LKEIAFVYTECTSAFTDLTGLIEILAALDALMNGSSWIRGGIDAGCLRRRRL